VGDVNLNEQHGLVVGIGENHVGAAYEISPAKLGHKRLLMAIKIQAARCILV
jgi:hypothetical protein